VPRYFLVNMYANHKKLKHNRRQRRQKYLDINVVEENELSDAMLVDEKKNVKKKFHFATTFCNPLHIESTFAICYVNENKFCSKTSLIFFGLYLEINKNYMNSNCTIMSIHQFVFVWTLHTFISSQKPIQLNPKLLQQIFALLFHKSTSKFVKKRDCEMRTVCVGVFREFCVAP
jgi:hypothetical protein